MPAVLGAALLAGVGAGVYNSHDLAVTQAVRWEKRVLPESEVVVS